MKTYIYMNVVIESFTLKWSFGPSITIETRLKGKNK